ncbi:M20 family metallopeptidase [Rarobacter faecitabidus]|uniref:Amidohydrolase n=1 Tax=Rarobacter faecitabidus TaxID=13243 RepID=A0A542ZV49_RARFA|nr:amidohydrolase [Rarobacter faecitabidus]
MSSGQQIIEKIHAAAKRYEEFLIGFRRDLHAHPELARTESRTTERIAQALRDAGLQPRLLRGTGLTCDIGEAASGARRVALRADLDALPIVETTGLPFASTVPGISHACGHDVHATAVLGAGLVLKTLDDEGLLTRPVRLIFQPAEEVMPGGALDVIEQGVLEGVGRAYALHCDPRFDVGQIGSRIGAITSASDQIIVTVSSSGGHTSRPHLTGDVVFAIGEIITQAPAIMGRRLDPRYGVNLTWGMVEAGQTANAIPATGTIKGTLRCLDVRAWEQAGDLLDDAVKQIAAPYGVRTEVLHIRGVPPVVNDEAATQRLDQAAREMFGDDSVRLTEQSLGGEDFAWILNRVGGAMIRLGVHTPGGPRYDIHRGDLVVDERAIAVGTRVLARTVTLTTPEISLKPEAPWTPTVLAKTTVSNPLAAPHGADGSHGPGTPA